MSICRGDLPSAKLAFKAISLFSKDPVGVLSTVLIRSSMMHFSVLPEEIFRLGIDDVWMVISGMCEANLDKRAYSIASLYIRDTPRNNPIVQDLIRWYKTSSKSTIPTELSTYIDTVLYNTVVSMNRKIKDTEYFRFSGVPFDEVSDISTIPVDYYLGAKSWILNYVVNYLNVISGYPKEDLKLMLNIFEAHLTHKTIQYEADYWQEMKKVVLGGNKKLEHLETLWITSLRQKALSLVIEVLETRLPILERG